MGKRSDRKAFKKNGVDAAMAGTALPASGLTPDEVEAVRADHAAAQKLHDELSAEVNTLTEREGRLSAEGTELTERVEKLETEAAAATALEEEQSRILKKESGRLIEANLTVKQLETDAEKLRGRVKTLA